MSVVRACHRVAHDYTIRDRSAVGIHGATICAHAGPALAVVVGQGTVAERPVRHADACAQDWVSSSQIAIRNGETVHNGRGIGHVEHPGGGLPVQDRVRGPAKTLQRDPDADHQLCAEFVDTIGHQHGIARLCMGNGVANRQESLAPVVRPQAPRVRPVGRYIPGIDGHRRGGEQGDCANEPCPKCDGQTMDSYLRAFHEQSPLLMLIGPTIQHRSQKFGHPLRGWE